MRRIHFFSTPGDVIPALERFEELESVRYIPNELAVCPPDLSLSSVVDLPEPGQATAEQTTASRSYLVLPATTKLICNPLAGLPGEKRWRPANHENPDSVELTMGGLWEDMMLPGLVTTVHDGSAAQSLMRGFVKVLKGTGFTKYGIWWLGREARSHWEQGMRLATAAQQSPPEYDLA